MRCDSIGGTTVVLVNKGFFGRWYTCWHSRDSRNSWHEATMNFCECLRIRIHLSHFWWTAWTRPYSYCLGKGVLERNSAKHFWSHFWWNLWSLSNWLSKAALVRGWSNRSPRLNAVERGSTKISLVELSKIRRKIWDGSKISSKMNFQILDWNQGIREWRTTQRTVGTWILINLTATNSTTENSEYSLIFFIGHFLVENGQVWFQLIV